jgi:outer membrane protein insertion porin family
LFPPNWALDPCKFRSTLVKTTESGWFAFLKTGDVYDPDRVEADSDLLRRFYLKSGFADVRVSGTGVYDPELRGFIVSFAIDEGERYRLGAVDIVSRVPAIDAAALRGSLRIASGSVYDGDAVAKAADAIALAAAKRGSPFVLVARDIGLCPLPLLRPPDGPQGAGAMGAACTGLDGWLKM